MKRLFTLLLATGIFMAADAQPFGHHPSDLQVQVRANGFTGNFAADRRMREEIARINFKYDRKADNVRRNYFMRPAVKAAKIRSIEQQRQRELNKLFRKHRYDYGNRRY